MLLLEIIVTYQGKDGHQLLLVRYKSVLTRIEYAIFRMPLQLNEWWWVYLLWFLLLINWLFVLQRKLHNIAQIFMIFYNIILIFLIPSDRKSGCFYSPIWRVISTLEEAPYESRMCIITKCTESQMPAQPVGWNLKLMPPRLDNIIHPAKQIVKTRICFGNIFNLLLENIQKFVSPSILKHSVGAGVVAKYRWQSHLRCSTVSSYWYKKEICAENSNSLE